MSAIPKPAKAVRSLKAPIPRKRLPRCKHCGNKFKAHVPPEHWMGNGEPCIYAPAIGKRQKKRTPLSIVKEKVWDAFAAYVKERDGDGCWACGRMGLQGSDNQASHLFNAGNHSAIRYHPLNVHPCCSTCNLLLRGNIAPYAANFIDRLGIENYLLLNAHARDEKKWTEPDLGDMLAALKRGGADFELWYEGAHGLANRA